MLRNQPNKQNIQTKLHGHLEKRKEPNDLGSGLNSLFDRISFKSKREDFYSIKKYSINDALLINFAFLLNTKNLSSQQLKTFLIKRLSKQNRPILIFCVHCVCT